MRLADARRDHYRRLAREQGLRSRAAYKLKELNRSYRVIGPGFYVADIGCAPGGWTQVAARLAGSRGRVVGVDTAHVDEVDGAEFVRADIEDAAVPGIILDRLGRRANAVVSDLSPNVTGNWTVDHARQISLNYSAAGVMERVLGARGNAVFKVFDGEYAAEFREYVGGLFSRVKATKPQASRKQSSELYLVCLGYRGRGAGPTAPRP